MIRINLARSTSVVSSSPNVGASAAAAVSSGASNPVVKVILIFILPIAVYVYEQRELGVKRKILAAESTKLEKIKADVSKYGSVTSAVEDIKRERNKLQKRLEVIAKISRKRASKILTISELQRVIPQDTWLSELTISGNAIKMNGFARSPSSVQNLVEKLVALKFLKSAVNNGVSRAKLGSTNLHKFSIDAEVMEGR